ncbi:hypothetical protein C8024_05990 [Sphingopyxis sp. BSNA05]|nr:hypothetical protein [Sphingopyxis sp. BSNA05]
MGEDLASLGDHAWSILVSLYTSESKGRKVTVSNITLGMLFPKTTALRYIGVLVKRGYINRVPSHHDKRVTYLRLTEDTHAQVTQILEKISRILY